jgi:competence protein/metallo-beta-lactamase superfamily protein
LRLPGSVVGVGIFLALLAYVGLVQDRPPILRAAPMAAQYLLARPLFRRVDLLNTIAIVAMILLIARPSSLFDSSFQLSFLAVGVIGALAIPWMEGSSAPYRTGLNHLGDVTRDAGHANQNRAIPHRNARCRPVAWQPFTDVVALTHAHHDHLDGLHAALANFRMRELWIGRDEETPGFLALLNEVRARGTTIGQQVQGHDFDWDGIEARVLRPANISRVTKPSNDNSLAIALDDGVVNFLLPGDIKKKVENELVAEDAPLKADFLKVPHHGSKTSSTDAFVAAAAPKFAVVSAGDGNQLGPSSG